VIPQSVNDLPSTDKVDGLDAIIDAVCQRHPGVTREALWSRERTERLVLARFLAFYVARHCTDLSFNEIARHFKKDHTSVINGVQAVEKRMSVNEVYRSKVELWVAFFSNRRDRK